MYGAIVAPLCGKRRFRLECVRLYVSLDNADAVIEGGPPCPDGAFPSAGVSFDKSGNLNGTTYEGAFDGKWGTVYRLTPQGDGIWIETTFHRFTAQAGGQPLSAVNFDPA